MTTAPTASSGSSARATVAPSTPVGPSILISCGGTGGHLSPGIALAEGLRGRGYAVTLLISEKKIDARLVEKYPHFEFVRIAGAPLAWSPRPLARFVSSQLRGLAFSRRLIRERRPVAIVGFGGFTSASILLAGAMAGVPVALHEANRVPGKAVRVMGRLAKRVYLPPGVGLPQAKPGIVRPAGLPVRAEIRRYPAAEARAAMGLRPEGKVVVVLGGSQGASSLNTWARTAAPALAAAGVQLYCVTGPGKGDGTTEQLPGPNGDMLPVIFSPFCDRMAELMSAADLVVSRAGAGTIAELVRCETPAVLVPYPFAADDHQAANAAYFVEHGGGVAVDDAVVAGITPQVLTLLADDAALAAYRQSLRRLEQADALGTVLDDLERLINPSEPPREAVGRAQTA